MKSNLITSLAIIASLAVGVGLKVAFDAVPKSAASQTQQVKDGQAGTPNPQPAPDAATAAAPAVRPIIFHDDIFGAPQSAKDPADSASCVCSGAATSTCQCGDKSQCVCQPCLKRQAKAVVASDPSPPAALPPAVTVHDLLDLTADERAIVADLKKRGYKVYEVGDPDAPDPGHWSIVVRDADGRIHYPTDRIVKPKGESAVDPNVPDLVKQEIARQLADAKPDPTTKVDPKTLDLSGIISCACGNKLPTGCSCTAKPPSTDKFSWAPASDGDPDTLILIHNKDGEQAGGYRYSTATFNPFADGKYGPACSPPIPVPPPAKQEVMQPPAPAPVPVQAAPRPAVAPTQWDTSFKRARPMSMAQPRGMRVSGMACVGRA